MAKRPPGELASLAHGLARISGLVLLLSSSLRPPLALVLGLTLSLHNTVIFWLVLFFCCCCFSFFFSSRPLVTQGQIPGSLLHQKSSSGLMSSSLLQAVRQQGGNEGCALPISRGDVCRAGGAAGPGARFPSWQRSGAAWESRQLCSLVGLGVARTPRLRWGAMPVMGWEAQDGV